MRGSVSISFPFLPSSTPLPRSSPNTLAVPAHPNYPGTASNIFFGILCNSADLANGGVKGQCDASCGLCAYALGPGTCENCGVGQYQPSADMMLFKPERENET